jgi:hypothetical protein
VGRFIADDKLFAVVLVQARLAKKSRAAVLAVRVRQHGAGGRQALGRRGIPVFLVLGEESDAGGVARVPGQARRQQHAIVFDVVDFRTGVLHHAGQAVKELPLIVQRATQVEAELLAIVVAGTQGDFMYRDRSGALADHVNDTARLVLAVEHRGRALEHFDALQGVRVDLQRAAGTATAIGQVQAVEVHRRGGEAARGRFVEDRHPVGEAATGHASGVTQGFGDALRTALLDLILGNDIDGLWNLNERRIGLGARPSFFRDDPIDRPPCRFPGARDIDGRQVQAGTAVATVQGHAIALDAVGDVGSLK